MAYAEAQTFVATLLEQPTAASDGFCGAGAQAAVLDLLFTAHFSADWGVPGTPGACSVTQAFLTDHKARPRCPAPAFPGRAGTEPAGGAAETQKEGGWEREAALGLLVSGLCSSSSSTSSS